MTKKLPELLAPAGTPDAAWAALAYGADAIYAGLDQFSARAEADNFSATSLDEMIGYAHHLDKRVFVTLNTLIKQRELGQALETLALLRDLNVDGVIVQDMGIVQLIRKNFPTLNLHASTQLAVHNLAGAQQLKSLGFKRAVLARELGLDAIEHISKNCGMETEAFIHGALCYSYSGLCLFSSHMLGRSGNRGRCAYCCRQPFNSGGKRTLPFSMKDFSAANQIDKLVDAGVTALKMEGRMKGATYVAAVTDFYRQTLDGTIKNPEKKLADIQTIFGRSTTELYLENEETSPIDPISDGPRGALIGTVLTVKGEWIILESNRALLKRDGLKIERPGKATVYGFAVTEMHNANDTAKKLHFELPANSKMAIKLPADAPYLEKGAAVYCSYSQTVRQQFEFTAPRPGQFRQRRTVNIHVVQSAEQLIVTASAGTTQETVTLPGPFESAKQPEKAIASMQKCFGKMGDTEWQLGKLTTEGPAIFAPASVLNEARRNLIDDFSERVNSAPEIPIQLEDFPVEAAADTLFWSVKGRRFYPVEGVDEFVLEIDPNRADDVQKAVDAMPGKVRLALPVIIREEDAEKFRQLIDQFPYVQKWEAANIGGLHLLEEKTDITADWSLYTMNTQAALKWREQHIEQFVLSPEDDAQNVFDLIAKLGSAAIVPVYQHTPLMISATKPEAASNEVTDRSERAFRIETNGREFVLTSKDAYSLTEQLDDLKAFGARNFRIDLSYGIDSPQEAIELVRNITRGESISGTDRNFSRGLL